MIPKGLFMQLAMMIVSVAIILTYVQPAFVELGAVQDQIKVYEDERKKIISVNSDLASLVDQMESVSSVDQRKLVTYLPDTVDTISVSRDLKIISEESGVLYKDVSSSGGGVQADDSGAIPYSFSLSVEGTYEQLKKLFSLLEQNNYPLEISELSVQPVSDEGGVLGAGITLVTYAYAGSSKN